MELSRSGIDVYVITNQAVVNRGTVPREIVEWINLRMQRAVAEYGGRVKAVAYCPHRPNECCGCRKPRPGLLLGLAARYDIDLDRSIVVGDALTDVEAAAAVGCTSILVLTGRGQEQLAIAHVTGRNGFAVAQDLRHAVDLILEQITPQQ